MNLFFKYKNKYKYQIKYYILIYYSFLKNIKYKHKYKLKIFKKRKKNGLPTDKSMDLRGRNELDILCSYKI